MSKIKKIRANFTRLYNSIPGSIYGLIAFGISIFAHLIGVLLYPNYDMATMTISQLSNGYGGLFYRIGLISTGIIAIPFCIYLSNSFKRSNNSILLIKFVMFSSVLYCISLIFIGYFWGPNTFISFIHGLFALVAWIDGLVFISLFSFLMLKDIRFPKPVAYFGFIVASTFLLHLLVLSTITQWIMTLSIMVWVWTISSFMIYKKI